jgi:hypothetical protein
MLETAIAPLCLRKSRIGLERADAAENLMVD